MRLLLPLLLLALVLPLAACDQQAMFDKSVPKEEAAFAKKAIAQLAARDYASVEAQLNPGLRTPSVRSKLEEMAKELPAAEPKSVRTVGAHTKTANPVTTYDLTFEYEYPDAWIVVNAVLERRDGNITVQGLHLTPRKQSLASENGFGFSGKGLPHYIVFALAIAVPLFIVYALIVCARTKIAKRKWLWLVFIAVGLVQLRFNWTTGACMIQPLSFALLGAGFEKSGPVAPCIFMVAFPLGAVLFLARRRPVLPSAGA